MTQFIVNPFTGQLDADSTSSGTVIGPGSSTVGDIAVFSNTTGNGIADSGILASSVVVGPASSTNNNFPSFNGTTGKLIKDSGFSDVTFFKVSNNLSEGIVATMRTNLGLGAAALLGTPIPSASGGTGVNNGSSTITLGGSLTTSGAFASTFTMTGITGVTFPTSGTLATSSQIPSLPSIVLGLWVP
jgi:hypothetical protein